MSTALTSSDDLWPARKEPQLALQDRQLRRQGVDTIRQLVDPAFEGLLEGDRVERDKLGRRHGDPSRRHDVLARSGLGQDHRLLGDHANSPAGEMPSGPWSTTGPRTSGVMATAKEGSQVLAVRLLDGTCRKEGSCAISKRQ